MDPNTVQQIIDNLSSIEADEVIPKNIRSKLKETIAILLDEDTNINLRIDKSIDELSELADDPNIQPYIRMQVWSIVSQLESR